MNVKELIKELSCRQARLLQNKLLVENTSGSSIVKIGDRKFAVTAQQREELISYLETAKTSRSREVEGEDGQMTVEEYEEAVAESANPDEIREQILNGLKEIGRVEPKKGRAIIFPSNIMHTGTCPINHENRLVINFVFKMPGFKNGFTPANTVKVEHH